jgi:hypothetical protein
MNIAMLHKKSIYSRYKKIIPFFMRPPFPATDRGLLPSFLKKPPLMPFDQYHEPPEELSQETRTLARMMASLIEEVEAINWYEQRISVEKRTGRKGHYEKCPAGRIQTLWDGPGVSAAQKGKLAHHPERDPV